MDNKLLAEELEKYYLPQLRFTYKGHRDFAAAHEDNDKIASIHNSVANGLEVAIGCLEEALATHHRAEQQTDDEVQEAIDYMTACAEFLEGKHDIRMEEARHIRTLIKTAQRAETAKKLWDIELHKNFNNERKQHD